MRHYADLIVNAQTEIFLATNYWERSHSSGLLSDSLRELSSRIDRRCRKNKSKNREKVVVKIMYDRGTPSQIFKNHASVSPEAWEELLLPRPEDMPNIDLQVVNFHRPPLGTHSP